MKARVPQKLLLQNARGFLTRFKEEIFGLLKLSPFNTHVIYGVEISRMSHGVVYEDKWPGINFFLYICPKTFKIYAYPHHSSDSKNLRFLAGYSLLTNRLKTFLFFLDLSLKFLTSLLSLKKEKRRRKIRNSSFPILFFVPFPVLSKVFFIASADFFFLGSDSNVISWVASSNYRITLSEIGKSCRLEFKRTFILTRNFIFESIIKTTWNPKVFLGTFRGTKLLACYFHQELMIAFWSRVRFHNFSEALKYTS